VSPADGGATDLDACTSVLLSVPRQLAERIESFLRANGIPCRIRLNTEMTPERLAQELLRQEPEASRVLDMPLLGPLLRGRLGRDLKAEIQVVGSDIPPVWDVLVRPEDLPETGDDADRVPAIPGLDVPRTAEVAASGEAAPSPGSPVVLCELAWDDAWRLTERLSAAGIPAAVMEGEGGDRDRPMSVRTVPVGVLPEDLDRARAFID
jgi:hypothetical protein